MYFVADVAISHSTNIEVFVRFGPPANMGDSMPESLATNIEVFGRFRPRANISADMVESHATNVKVFTRFRPHAYFFAYMASFFATNCLRLAITYFGLTTIFLSLWVSFDLATAWFGLATLNTYLFFEGFHKHFHLLACDCLPILWAIDMTFLAYLFGLVISSESAPGASISVFGVTEIFVGFSTTFLGANRGGGACTTWLHISHFTKYPIEMSLP